MHLRRFVACTFEVIKLRLFQAFCTSFYCAYLWYKFSSRIISKVRVAYNNVFRFLFGCRKRCSASQMLVANNVRSFEGRIRKHVKDFTLRVDSSKTSLITTLRNNSFVHGGPLRLRWVRSVYLVYN